MPTAKVIDIGTLYSQIYRSVDKHVKAADKPKPDVTTKLQRPLITSHQTRTKEVQELLDMIPPAPPNPELVAINGKLDAILHFFQQESLTPAKRLRADREFLVEKIGNLLSEKKPAATSIDGEQS